MTERPLEPIDLLDTDCADILANSSHPAFEMQLVRSGIDATKARTATNFIALMRQKPHNPEGRAALTDAWEAACGTLREWRKNEEWVTHFYNAQYGGSITAVTSPI